MNGVTAGRAQPLRPEDPSQLGPYHLTGRLGEGGMGLVYLATTADGRPVAVKVIRRELTDDQDFRRRFRGEVERAQQVPPFCTAEVLDADPDCATPYLVVEYVDGPSLGQVIRDRGPLSPANLHGLAIGVAAALTAIHQAGVIHRDLKPSNVLLAPGSPKVIDFGIARPVDAATTLTQADRLMGTVAYMAPERFALASSKSVTPAADVFAWGAVVAYAGTGHAPFEADSLPAMAVRIMSDPPDLGDLSGQLRELVSQALAKEPRDRPTARQLLERLLGGAPEAPAAPVPARAGAEATITADTVVRAIGGGTAAQPTTPLLAPPPVDRRAGGLVTAALLVAVLLAALAGGVLTGLITLPPLRSGGTLPGVLTPPLTAPASPSPSATASTAPASPSPSASPSAPPSVSARPSPTGSVPAGSRLVYTDPLDPGTGWVASSSTAVKSSCTPGTDGLTVLAEGPGSYRCVGRSDSVGTMAVFVDVQLLTPGSCAAVWFRFVANGYALRVCQDRWYLVIHGLPASNSVTTLHTYLVTPVPVGTGTATRVGISATADEITILRDGKVLDSWSDPTFDAGKIALGIFEDGSAGCAPCSVRFRDVALYGIPATRS